MLSKLISFQTEIKRIRNSNAKKNFENIPATSICLLFTANEMHSLIFLVKTFEENLKMQLHIIKSMLLFLVNNEYDKFRK
ncbi:hypothetical protein QKK82_gp01 [Mayetiola barley midge adintovirus]|uniref:hypothetical protein n=1 Tax=Mayetiola barley midge adintovirus TaxID=2609858 RepID=UPI0024820641|nr:hypothetical protein QKK82_gp01 [Mayetiola barley midge adintovirus]DAC81319.1 TPA_asm: hypothetical protein [Mayetiola barley midge adintovirus]